MANYATNLFFASCNNANDIERIEKFLEEHFDTCHIDNYEECIEAEFESRWEFPESLMNDLVASLESKDEAYIRVLTHELANEYVSFRIFTNGEWDGKALCA